MNPLVQFRKERGLTQQQMADLLGIHRVKYAKVELGYQKPDIDFITAMCRAFRLCAEDVYRIFVSPNVSESEHSKERRIKGAG